MNKSKCDADYCCDGCGYQGKIKSGGCCGGAIYGLGVIGALVFFVEHATNFWAGVLGVLQAFVWPAYVVYEALKVLIK